MRRFTSISGMTKSMEESSARSSEVPGSNDANDITARTVEGA